MASAMKLVRNLKGHLLDITFQRLFSATTSVNQLIKVTTPEPGVIRVCLNNPKSRNALSYEMLTNICKCVRDVANDKANRVVILSAEGTVFSSGHNLKELSSSKPKEFHQKVFNSCTEVMTLLQSIPLPVIAEVKGLATAAGCQLVASCDIVVASEEATFATPGVNVGLFCSTPAVALVRSVPSKVALEMLLTGEPISASKACLYGLVSKVAPNDQVEQEVMKIANKICMTSPEVIALGKRYFYQQIGMNRDQAYQLTEEAMVHNLTLEHGKEGIQAFIEKRKPVWK